MEKWERCWNTLTVQRCGVGSDGMTHCLVDFDGDGHPAHENVCQELVAAVVTAQHMPGSWRVGFCMHLKAFG